MYFSVFLLSTLLHVTSGDWAENGTWINPPYCTNQQRECPPFNQLDDGTKPYEIHEYLPAKWMCIDFSTTWPQTSEDFYQQVASNPRHWHFNILRNYTLGDNAENLTNIMNLPARTHMYYTQNVNGDYLKIANTFKMCFYLTLVDEPEPNDPSIYIGVEPSKTYYVWSYNSHNFNVTRHEAELENFLNALSGDSVTDYDRSFHITCGYGPYQNLNAYNELWLERI